MTESTALSSRGESTHMIADAASDQQKAAAFEWLRSIVLDENRTPAIRRLAAIAQDEWHRLKELASTPSEKKEPSLPLPDGVSLIGKKSIQLSYFGDVTPAEAKAAFDAWIEANRQESAPK